MPLNFNSSHSSASGEKRAYIRRFKRYGVDKRIRVIAGEGGKQVVFNGRCHVLSEGGFGAVVAGVLPEREIVQIEFAADDIAQTLRLKAAVRYSSGFHHGFEFVAPTDTQKHIIGELFAESVQVG